MAEYAAGFYIFWLTNIETITIAINRKGIITSIAM